MAQQAGAIRVRSGMGGRRRHLLSSVAAGVLLLIPLSNSQAGPELCSVSGGAATCSGDQSSGIEGGVDFDQALAERLRVVDLTADIAPAENGDGINFTRDDGVQILTAIGDFAIVTRGSGHGIFAMVENDLAAARAGRLLIENGLAIAAGGHGIVAHTRSEGAIAASQLEVQQNGHDLLLVPDAFQALNDSDQAFAFLLDPSAGAIAIRNRADIQAGGTGILAVSESDGVVEIANLAEQRNDARQELGASAFSSGPPDQQIETSDKQALQENLLEQSFYLGGGEGAGTIVIANSGRVAAGEDGIAASVDLRSETMIDQLAEQQNLARQEGAAAAAADGPGSWASATLDLTAELAQLDLARQGAATAEATGAGNIFLLNEGEVAAGGSGLVARTSLFFSEDRSQAVVQANSSLQEGYSAVAAEGGTAFIGTSLDLEAFQLLEVQQDAARSTAAGAGAISVQNSGSVAAEADGIVAQVSFGLAAQVLQSSEQDNFAGQRLSGVAAELGSGAAESWHSADLSLMQMGSAALRLNAPDASGAGSIAVVNNGTLHAGGSGIAASADVLLLDQQAQESLQSSLALQAVDGLVVAADGGPLLQLDVLQQAAQLHQDRLHVAGIIAAGAARVAVENNGLVVAEVAGLDAHAGLEHLALRLQSVEQENGAEQEATGIAVASPTGAALLQLDVEQELLQANRSMQTATTGDAAGAGSIDVANRGTIIAGGEGIAARSSLMLLDATQQSVLQANDNNQGGWTAGIGSTGAAVTQTGVFQAGVQSNESLQSAERADAAGAGAVRLHNEGVVVAGGDGIVAEAVLLRAAVGAQQLEQKNLAEQIGESVSMASAPDGGALVDPAQGRDWLQVNESLQEMNLGGGDGAGSVLVLNSGVIIAEGAGIAAEADLSMVSAVEQAGGQRSEDVQDGEVRFTGEAAGMPALLQQAVQSDYAVQTASLAEGAGQGSVEVGNNGQILAEGDGILATADASFLGGGLQDWEQVNDALQLSEAEGGALLQYRDQLQHHHGQQEAVLVLGDGLAAVSIDNSGLIVAGDGGIVAGSALQLEYEAGQSLFQNNQSRQLGLGAGSLLQQQDLVQVNGAEQRKQVDLGAGVGAASVVNSGDLFAEGDGIVAGTLTLSRFGVAQGGQHFNNTDQELPDVGAAGSASGPELASVTRESQVGQDAQRFALEAGPQFAGITVDNSGAVTAGGSGILAAADAKIELAIRQRVQQANRASQVALGGPPGMLQLQSVDQANDSLQSAGMRLGARTAAITLDNSGTVVADGDGLIARSRLGLVAEISQEIEQDNIAGQLLQAEDGSQQRDVWQSNAAVQVAVIELGEQAGRVAVDNSGVVIAGGTGVHAETALSAELFMAQVAEQLSVSRQSLENSTGSLQGQILGQTSTADQLIRTRLGEGAGSLNVANSGLIAAEGDGVIARSRIDFAAWLDGSDISVSSTINQDAFGSIGSEQDQDARQTAFAEQAVDVGLAPSAAAVTVENSGVILAGGHGILAESVIAVGGNFAGDGTLPAGSVRIVNNGTLITDGRGIRAGSGVLTPFGPAPGGPIEIVIGEVGVVAAGTGYAVDIAGGSTNSLLNRGLIVSEANRAVRGGDGDETVINYGTLIGNVNLGGGSNLFDNRAGGLFVTGRRVALNGGRLLNAGDLSPGGLGTIQRTRVEGDLVQQAGSRYLVDIAPGGMSDRLQVTGTATIEDGAGVYVEKAYGEYPFRSQYKILTARQGVEGSYELIDQNLPFLEFRLDYGPRAVFLDIGRSGTDFVEVARSSNQRNVARALGSFGPVSDNPLYNIVVWLDEEEAPEVFDSLSGEVHASVQSVPLDLGRRLRRNLMNRLSGSGGGTQGGLQSGNLASLLLADSDADPAPAPAPGREKPMVWLEAYGGSGSQDGDGNAAEVSSRSWGTMLGGELLLSDNFGVGLAAGYQGDRLDIDQRGSRAEVESYSLSAYGLWRSGPWRVRGGASFAWHDFDTRRTVTLPTGDRRAEAAYNGWSAQTFGELGYRLDLQDVSLEPFAGLSYLHSRTESYRESGAGAANLTASSDRASSVVSTLGVQVSQSFDFESGLKLRPHGSIAWERRLTGSSNDAELGFAAGGDRFRVSGPRSSKDAALVGVGLDIGLDVDVEAFATYDAYLSRTQRDHTARAGIRIRF